MTKPLLHFTHGNSFPAGVYRRFFDGLRDDFDVHAIDMVGHDDAFPVSDGWPGLVAELIAQLEGYPEPAILVGHSLGGMLSLMAAKQRPDLARCVVMLDSPVVTGWRAWLLRVAKARRWDDNFSPAKASQRAPHRVAGRRGGVPAFRLEGHLRGVGAGRVGRLHGARPDAASGWRAAALFARSGNRVSTARCRTIWARWCEPPFPVPIGFVGGDDSFELRQAGLDATRRLVGRHFSEIEGGHLFPMESPELAAS